MTDQLDTPFAANDVRLSPHEWVIALALVAATLAVVPIAWERLEPLDIAANHRTPFSLGSDYWTYSRYCRAVCAKGDKTLILGDSVIWGHYVGKDETLSAHLNKAMGESASGGFANLGIDGIHPVALAGLMEHYGQGISRSKVILHCNLLWMSSQRRDLRTEKEFPFNHPPLVPQFRPRVPCYKAPVSHRLGVVIGRKLPFFGWSSHMQIAYLDDSDLATWTIDHPYDNPAEALSREPPSPDEAPSPKPDARPWTEKGIKKFNPPWVDLAGSLQWARFKRTLEILADRDNRVFVLVGPFNEHMLKEESLATYTKRKVEARTWLGAHGIPHYMPRALPSEAYADASHPLGEGYGLLAEQLVKNEAFIRFAGNKESPTMYPDWAAPPRAAGIGAGPAGAAK